MATMAEQKMQLNPAIQTGNPHFFKINLRLKYPQKRKVEFVTYLLFFGVCFELDLDFVFSCTLTGFIGWSQQTISHVSQPHGSSTAITSPHSSHLYLSPFLAAKN